MLAQSAPPYRNLDANGVDLTLGDLVVTFPEGSIGSGDATLALNRIISDGSMTSNWDNYGFKLVRSGSTVTITISRPDFKSDTFSMPALGSSTTTNPNGTSLTRDINAPDYVYTMKDGTAVSFINPNYDVVPPDTYYCSMSSPTTGCAMIAQTVTSPNGNIVTLRFNAPTGGAVPKLTGVSNGFGYSIAFTYSGYTRTRADFKHGATIVGSISYTYPTGGIDITDMAGNVWLITPTSITRPGEASPSFSVGGSGSAVTSVTKDGVTTTYARTVSGTTGTMVVTDPLGNHTTIVSNLTTGRPTSVTDALSHTTTFGYDASARLTQVTQPENNYVKYTLDARGNATETDWYPKSGTGFLKTSAVYPTTCTNAASCNKPTSTTDLDGNTTNYSYDPTTGLVTAVTSPAPATGGVRPETRYTYTSVGGANEIHTVSQCQTGSAPSCVGTADEVKSTIAYDANGNVSSVTRAAGNGSLTATIAYTYDALGNRLTADGPLAGTADTTTWRYDAARRQVGAIAPDPDGTGAHLQAAVRTTYDTAGRVTKVETGTVAGTTDANWAAFASATQRTTTWTGGRKAQDVLTAGGTTYQVAQYSYDTDGRPLCTAQRMNSATWGTITDACTQQATGTYGPDRITKTSYDQVGRRYKTTTIFSATVSTDDTTATFNPNGTTATLTDANHNLTTYTYDVYDRLTKTAYPSPTTPNTSSTTDYEELVYDPLSNNVTSHHLRGYGGDTTQHIDYSYDHLNRVTLKNLPGSELDVTYGYDNLSRLTSAATSAQTLTFGYDALSRMTSQGGPLGTVSTQYDAAGERTRLTWPDTFYVTYDYDSAGNLLHIRENGATSGIGVLASFGYDNLGNRTSLTRGNGTTTSYTPDAISRLSILAHDLAGTTADVTTTFSYNPVSQIASTTRSNDAYATTFADAAKGYTINGLNQMTTAGTDTIGYDTKGNVTIAGTSSYTYSSENLLLTGPSAASLVYDPLLRLYQDSATGFAATRFQYDGQHMAAEYDSSGTLQKRYVFGPGADEALVEYDRSGSAFVRAWLYADERGSIIARGDDTGAAIAINTYDEYGVPGAGNVGRFQYTGQAWLPELGVYYYKARMYSSRLGRFLQTDPIGYGNGLNWYNYVGGNPINGVDPGGTQCTGSLISSVSCGELGDPISCSGNCSSPTPDLVKANVADSGGGAGGTGVATPAQIIGIDPSTNCSTCVATSVMFGPDVVVTADPFAVMAYQAPHLAADPLFSIAEMGAMTAGTAGIGLAAEGGFSVAGRVAELQEAIPLAQQGRITMGVGLAEDANGVQQILIGTSEPMGYLRPGVTLNPGEILAPGLGHAEADIFNFAQQNGLNILEYGATRPICPSCATLGEGAGATPVTPLKVP
jgi:RHS repeat-associated protein